MDTVEELNGTYFYKGHLLRVTTATGLLLYSTNELLQARSLLRLNGVLLPGNSDRCPGPM